MAKIDNAKSSEIHIEDKDELDNIEQMRSVMYKEDGTAMGIDEVIVHYKKPWYLVPHQLRLVCIIFVVTLTSTNVGYDGSMMNGLQSLPIWRNDMGKPEGTTLGLLTNSSVLGQIAGMLFVSYIIDTWGRKYGIYIGNFFCIIGAVLQGASNHFKFYLGARVVLGISGAFGPVSAPALISELAHPSHRPVCTSFYNVCWWLGALLGAGVTFGTKQVFFCQDF